MKIRQIMNRSNIQMMIILKLLKQKQKEKYKLKFSKIILIEFYMKEIFMVRILFSIFGDSCRRVFRLRVIYLFINCWIYFSKKVNVND